MTTIVTRAGKGSELTHVELDANFNNLNNDKAETTHVHEGTTIDSTGELTNKVLTTDGAGNVTWKYVDTLSTNLNAGSNRITDLADPLLAQDAATKTYVDSNSGIASLFADPTPTLSTNLDAGSNRITNLADPLLIDDAATKSYVDAATASGISAVVEDTTPVLGGNLDAGSNRITNMGDPLLAQDAATKTYVDSNSGIASLSADTSPTLSTNLNAASNRITDLADPLLAQDAATKTYVDSNSGISSLFADPAPALSTNLDAGDNRITNLGDPLLTQDAATKAYVDAAVSGGTINIVDDLTPQLGGNLDVNGNSITSTAAGNIAITPDTTGNIVLDGLNWPQSDGTSGQVLSTNGLGQLSWTTAGGGSFSGDLAGNDLSDSTRVFVGVSENMKITPTATTTDTYAGIYVDSTGDTSGNLVYPVRWIHANGQGGYMAAAEQSDGSVTGLSNNRVRVSSKQGTVTAASTPAHGFAVQARICAYNGNTTSFQNRTFNLLDIGSGFINNYPVINSVGFSNTTTAIGYAVDAQEATNSYYVFNNGDTAIYDLLSAAKGMKRRLLAECDNPVSNFKLTADDASTNGAWYNALNAASSSLLDQNKGFGVSWKVDILVRITQYNSNATVTVDNCTPRNGRINDTQGGTLSVSYLNTPSWFNTSTNTITMTRPASGTTYYKMTVEYLSEEIFVKDWETYTV